jgi:hypothetical protein
MIIRRRWRGPKCQNAKCENRGGEGACYTITVPGNPQRRHDLDVELFLCAPCANVLAPLGAEDVREEPT